MGQRPTEVCNLLTNNDLTFWDFSHYLLLL